MSNLVIITGDEEFLKERAAEDEAHMTLIPNIYRFRSDELDDYVEISQILSLQNEPRVYIVFDVKEVPVLPVNSADTLIVVTKGKVTDSRAKRIVEFPELKSFDDKNDYIPWILKEGSRIGLDLENVATALFVNCGKSPRKIFSEIKKLAVLASNGTVSLDDARSVMCFSADLTPKGIIDSICDGNSTRALAFYDKLMELGDETGWIIAYMQRHVLQQVRMENLQAKGVPSGDIPKILNIHPFVFRKTMVHRFGLWSDSSLRLSFETLCGLELAHKQGNSSALFGLEVEIVRLSEEAKNVYRSRGH